MGEKIKYKPCKSCRDSKTGKSSGTGKGLLGQFQKCGTCNGDKEVEEYRSLGGKRFRVIENATCEGCNGVGNVTCLLPMPSPAECRKAQQRANTRCKRLSPRDMR